MEQTVNAPCPTCGAEEGLRLRTHIDDIPYFGEHTQVTLLCVVCGWRQTDLIPAEAQTPTGWTLELSSPRHLTARVVRSTACTVRMHEQTNAELTCGALSSRNERTRDSHLSERVQMCVPLSAGASVNARCVRA